MTSELAVDVVRDTDGPEGAIREQDSLRKYHLFVLAASASILAAAFLLRVRPDQRIELAGLPGWAAPELCQTRALFGWNCPGCGLTRSFVHLAAGDVDASLAVNRVGWVFAMVVCLQLPYRLWAVCSAEGRPLGRRVPWLFVWVPFALLVANWIVQLASLIV